MKQKEVNLMPIHEQNPIYLPFLWKDELLSTMSLNKSHDLFHETSTQHDVMLGQVWIFVAV